MLENKKSCLMIILALGMLCFLIFFLFKPGKEIFSDNEVNEEKTDTGLEIFIKNGLFEASEDIEFVISKSDNEIRVPITVKETSKISVKVDGGQVYISPHCVYGDAETGIRKIELQYLSGEKITILSQDSSHLNMATDIMDAFTKLNSEGTTVIIVTHDMDVAKRCKRIIEIKDGSIVSDSKEKYI